MAVVDKSNSFDLLYADGLDRNPISTGDSMYDQLFANNPYKNQTYNRTGLQGFLSDLGFRTGYDRWSEEIKKNSAEYDARIFELMQQNAYNDPTAQAQRERAGGMNPDLLGIGDVAEAASQAPDPNGVEPSSDHEGMFSGLVSMVTQKAFSIVPSVMSFMTNLTNLKGMRIENDNKELALGSSAMDLANKFFLEGITEQDYRDAFEKNDWTNILKAAQTDSDYLTETMLSSPAARKKFKLAYGMHANSLIAKMQKYKTYDDFEAERKNLLSRRASPFFDDSDDVMDSLLSSVFGPLERWQKRMYEINEKYGSDLYETQLQNQQAYENIIDPAAQAEAENAANTRMSQENEIVTATNEMFEKIMNSLSEKDTWYNSLAKTLVGMVRAYIMQGVHAQFGRRQTTIQQTPDGGMMIESSNNGIQF